jgi:hypothetical protein
VDKAEGRSPWADGSGNFGPVGDRVPVGSADWRCRRNIAPLRAGPSTSAGTSMNRKPAACANVAVTRKTSTTRKSAAWISSLQATRAVAARPITAAGFLFVFGTFAFGPVVGKIPPMNQRLPRPRDRRQPQADRSEQPHLEAVFSWPGLSPLPRFVGLGRLSVDNSLPVAVFRRPAPEEAPPPIPFRFTPWFRRVLRLAAITVR